MTINDVGYELNAATVGTVQVKIERNPEKLLTLAIELLIKNY